MTAREWIQEIVANADGIQEHAQAMLCWPDEVLDSAVKVAMRDCAMKLDKRLDSMAGWSGYVERRGSEKSGAQPTA